MSIARSGVNELHRLPVFPHLGRYRPLLKERRVWVIVVQIAAISATHTILETVIHLPAFGLLYFIPSAFFLVPVVYAALSFGLKGALTTSLVATVITIPNWFLFHESWETLGCMSQLFVVNVAAYFIGRQVNRVKSAQQEVEAVNITLRASETKYRGLFESTPIAILVVDSIGIVRDANPAAGVLFNRRAKTLKGTVFADLVGTVDAQRLLDAFHSGRQPDPLIIEPPDGLKLHIEPTLTKANDGQGNSIIQVLFRDITEERHRQAGLRAYAARVLRVQEEERQRIARELHDVTVQQLVLLYHQLGSLQDGESVPSTLADALREARGTTEEVVKELREFTRDLRPPILEDLGLVTTVRRLLSDLTQRTTLKGQMKVVGKQRRLSSDIELGMFRITQEALRNIERHARATQIAVTVTFADQEISLEVQDDGIGFTLPPIPGDFTASGQLGLIGMQERAAILNGKLEVQSSPGGGTRIIVSVPV